MIIASSKQEWNYCEFIRKTQSMSFESKKFQPKQTTQNATRNFPNQNQNPQNNPFQRRNFQNPSQNPENPQGFKYNINTKLPTPQRLPTNAQVFGNKPPSNTFKTPSKPTPMSVQYHVPQHTPKSVQSHVYLLVNQPISLSKNY